MGTWAVDAFGNDDACDWAYGLKDIKDTSLVDKTLAKASGAGSNYLEAPDASEALAAAEVVARLQGNFGERNSYTEAVDAWVNKFNKKPNAALCKKAHGAIDRILSEPSELLELWQESDEFDVWKQSVLELRARIVISSDGSSSDDTVEKKQSLIQKLFGKK